MTKIEKWAQNIVVGQCGTRPLTEMMLSAVKSFVDEEGIDNYTLEDIAETCCQAYYAARTEYEDMPKEAIAKIVVAGKLENGQLGAILVYATNDEADIEIHEAQSYPSTLILEPDDVSSEICNELYRRALAITKKPEMGHQDLLETVHRKAVRFVAQRSKFVSKESDYIVIIK